MFYLVKSDRYHIGRDKIMAFVCENDLKNLLRDVFGYADFRSGHLEIIREILAQKSVLAVMPTGAAGMPVWLDGNDAERNSPA